MDVDGTLTDGKIYIGNSGELFKSFNVKDGYAIHNMLISSGIKPIIITGRKSDIVNKRCEELGITELHQGIENKVEKLDEILQNTSYNYSNIAYIGDDLNDFSCMQAIKAQGGIVGCPIDAIKKIVDIADFISSKKGGEGAVREFIEWILE